MTTIRRTLTVAALAVLAAAAPVSAASAATSKKRCSAVQREFFPWQCR
jgi:hypothetical protein